MKRIIFIFLALLMAVSCVSCNRSSDAGEPITELDWERMKTGDFDNFTGERRENNSLYGETVVSFWQDGDQWRNRMVQNGKLVSQSGQFMIDGKLVYCVYNTSTHKWEKQAENKAPYPYPFKGMNYNFNLFTYDEEKCVYVYRQSAGEQSFTEEEVLSGQADMIFRFVDGKCVYSKNPKVLPHIGTIDVVEVEVSNYGTTVVPIPSLDDIVDAPAK
ncbi:MAG: hypothetical protein IJF55_04425 [Clostridia bacterium]|nr:hypothetical protein [Clostridia bacterium]